MPHKKIYLESVVPDLLLNLSQNENIENRYVHQAYHKITIPHVPRENSLTENVDQALHEEVLERSKVLNIPPYAGFINPHYKPVTDENEAITDIIITYPDNFLEQMLYYDEHYALLPLENN